MKHIRTFTILIGFIILTISAKAQSKYQQSKQATELNKEIFKIIKKNSLFSDDLNWKEIKSESTTLAFTDNDSINEQLIFDFYKQKLRAVGDKHSFFISSRTINEISKAPMAEMPQGEYLGDGIGWVKVPRLMTFDEKKDIEFANSIRTIIEKIDTENTITGWIVDLRHNGGGNMWPMIAGLNALIDDGTAGYFVQGKTRTPWPNENGKILGKTKSVNTYKIKNNKVKIAVLFDAQTGSSGEMTAVSFLGLPNVKSFGQTTSGYITANQTFPLSNGGQLLLATTYVTDRTGKGYKGGIIPDVTVDDLSNTKNDNVIKTAAKWLNEN
ncbi:S41 family peptidase [Flavobacterium sp. MK4S-17]|uniref:S41 family peptidase n=1 Tax=Flavobacterium sp. MK4S-17 TaxID=2543737 RepID=UPI00135ACFA0|nr:S41 family peptidase [Flavobacterium sp. MK4S-17]